MKLKTSKSASKRILKFTRKGKIIRRRATAQHLAANKSKRVRRQSGRSVLVNKSSVKKIKKLIPYR